MPSIEPEDVLSFWLGPDRADHDEVAKRSPTWFAVDEAFDATLRDRFAAAVDEASQGELSSWEETPEGRLALILLLDQMRRNLFRDTAAMVEKDAEALRLVLEGFEAGHFQRLHLFEKVFFLMPFQHSEDLAVQAEGVERFSALAEEARREGVPPAVQERFDSFVKFAERHRVVVERFGRFPHRNAFLGRATPPEEQRFLDEKGRF